MVAERPGNDPDLDPSWTCFGKLQITAYIAQDEPEPDHVSRPARIGSDAPDLDAEGDLIIH